MDDLRFKSILKPLKHQVEEECIQAVRKNYRELYWVRDQTDAICKAALDAHIRAMAYIRTKTPELCEYALKKNGYAIRFVPQTEEYCWMALRSPETFIHESMNHTCEGVYSIHFFENPTDEMIRYAIEMKTECMGRIFAFIPEESLKEEHIVYGLSIHPSYTETISDAIPPSLQTPRIVEQYIKQHAYSMRLIREDLLTAELCQTAFDLDLNTIIFIPMKYQTQAMIDLLVEREQIRAYMIDHINPEFFSESFFQHVICTIDPEIFAECPDKYKTPLLCRSLVKYKPTYLLYVPREMKTLEMCEMAVHQDGRAIEYVPDEWKKSLYLTAVRNDYFALALIPKEDITLELAEAAMENNMQAFSYIPREIQTKELCKQAVRHDWSNIRFCRFKTEDICNIAIEQNITAIVFIRAARNKPEYLTRLASENYKAAVNCLKSEEYTLEICDILLEKSPNNIHYFPSLFQTEDMHLRALKKSIHAWYEIPAKYRTQKLVDAFLIESPESADFFRNEVLK